MLLYQTLAFTLYGEIYKGHAKVINLKYCLRYELSLNYLNCLNCLKNKSLNYLMGPILYQIFKITLNILKKNMEKRLIILQ